MYKYTLCKAAAAANCQLLYSKNIADSVTDRDFGQSGWGRYLSNHFWDPSVEDKNSI